MPAKQKNAKRQRAPRVVSNPTVVNRTGGRKPQPVRITNAARVAAIQNAVLKEAKQFLTYDKVELTYDIEWHLEHLIGITDVPPYDGETYVALATNDPSVDELRQTIETIEKAFYRACKLVPDSQFAYVGDAQAVRGRQSMFFVLLKEQDEQDTRSRRNQRIGNHRHQANRSKLQSVATASGMSN